MYNRKLASPWLYERVVRYSRWRVFAARLQKSVA
jgi:hypothetical protein